MKSLYRKLAFINMKSNKQFYYPYALASVLSAVLYYTMSAIKSNPGLDNTPGSNNLKTILSMGFGIISIFVCILLFYTNSFVIKRRKKELGVYNILGMEKKHIARVLFWETMFLFFFTTGGGIVIGIVFNKFLTMLLYRLSGLSESIPFYISGFGIFQTVVWFGMLDLAILIYNFVQVKLSNPVELLRGGNTGEKEPKTKLLLAVFGVASLGAAYYIAITTENILEVLTLFFVAVLLVIAGTYVLFTAGSIAFLKLLRSNKRYYYQARHFTSVSGMIYRMKQNAAGLASICILSTMVLVMISTTVCLYVGVEDQTDKEYAGEVNVYVYYDSVPDAGVRKQMLEEVKKSVKEQGRTVTGAKTCLSLWAGMKRENNQIIWSDDVIAATGQVIFMTKEDYEALQETTLGDFGREEIAVASYPEYAGDAIDIFGKEYPVAETSGLSEKEAAYADLIEGGITYLIVKDDDKLSDMMAEVQNFHPGGEKIKMSYEAAVDIDGTAEEKKACANAVRERMAQLYEAGAQQGPNMTGFSVQSKQERYEGILSFSGSFLFLGLFLGILFLMETVLIIYYKQISEGYEDKERFAIMQKVGMSRKEVKDAIRSQIRTVFFLPLVMAAIHLSAAFPMLNRMLAMFGLFNRTLFAACLAGTLLVFGVIYFLVFKATSNSYYKIVGEQF